MWVDVNLRDRWYYVLYPRSVAVVSASYGGSESAMPASWCTPVSRDPPIVAVAISPKRYTYELIKASKEFAISVFDYRYLKEVNYLGSVSGRRVPDKVLKSGLTKVAGRVVKAPVFKEASGVLECKLYKDIEAGDHNLVVGEVVVAYAKGELWPEPNVREYKAILQVAGTDYTTTLDKVDKL